MCLTPYKYTKHRSHWRVNMGSVYLLKNLFNDQSFSSELTEYQFDQVGFNVFHLNDVIYVVLILNTFFFPNFVLLFVNSKGERC